MKSIAASNFLLTACLCGVLSTAFAVETRLVPVGEGWAQNSINVPVYRRDSLVTHEPTQYTAFYDPSGRVILGKRGLEDESWQLIPTQYWGDVLDAHRSISIGVDGNGILHLAWDHHNTPLRYCRTMSASTTALSDELPMTGLAEGRLSYPEFYRLPDGNLLFLYRDGSSGRGNLVLNHYDCRTQTWTQRQGLLIDGEKQRNAYWQACVDDAGVMHLSWVWRESPDVATNHDMCYARSDDGGVTWKNSSGEVYQLPITAATAEYACRIPQESELINSTSMTTDAQGHPYIATYWRPEGTLVPQYHLIFHDGTDWHTVQVSSRTTPFSLSGGGTKRIPISRPQLVVDASDMHKRAYLLFRDEERGNYVSLASCTDLDNPQWHVEDLTDFPVDMWEPTIDIELWRHRRELHVFVQRVEQGDAETTELMPPTMVSVLECSALDAE